jgi:SHS2 domain-containing protein
MQAGSRSEEHVGEWKVTLWADTLPELFTEAARVIARACGPTRGAPRAWESIALTSRDVETLLVDWANELLGRSEIAQLAYGETRGLEIADGRITGEVRGRSVTDWRSPLKAAT